MLNTAPAHEDELSTAFARAVDATTELVSSVIEAFLGAAPGDDWGSDLWRPEDCEHDELYGLLREVDESGSVRQLVLMLRTVAERGPHIERTVVAWIDLLEELVQFTETRYGRASGRGYVKASDVRAVVDYLLRSRAVFGRRMSGPVRNLAADAIGGWLSRVIVQVADDYGLWTTVEHEPATLTARLELALKKARLWLKPFFEGVAAIADAVWRLFRRRRPLSPGLARAVRALEREAERGSTAAVSGTLAELFRWAASHGDEAIAAIRLVFDAVYEIERFGNLTGPEKKRSVRNTILCLLNDLGLPLGSPVLVVVASTFIDGSIEAAVRLFDKRGAFERAAA